MTAQAKGIATKIIWWLLGIFASAIMAFSAWAASNITHNCERLTGLERDIVYIRDALERIEAGMLRTDDTLSRLRDEIGRRAGKDFQ
jgi:hypothetical protein